MRLTTRMTLGVGTAAVLLFGGGGWALLRAEERDLRGVAAKEALLLGRSLQTAIENALRDRQIEDVTETLVALAKVDPAVALFVFDEEGRLVGASEGASPVPDTLATEQRARKNAEPAIAFVPEGDPVVLRLGLRLRDEGAARASSIVLEKPLDELRRDLHVTQRNVVTLAGVFVLATLALTWQFTRLYVVRPVGGLVSDMRRVRRGDLTRGSWRRGTDELEEARTEFDALVADLDEARAVAEREAEARRRIERGLQEADKLIMLGQLSAVIAHEIGSPLQVLEGRARSLQKQAADPELVGRTATTIVEQTRRIARLVEQMLSITRRRPPARAWIDAEQAVRSVISLLELEARRGSITLVDRCLGASRVFADADQLQQVVLNLTRNALQAAPPGSEVSVTVGGDEDWLVLDVRDQGPGVAPSLLPHLFEPFFTTRVNAGGTGLGLSVVRSIVQEHGGTVRFEATGEGGAWVRVRLPRRPEVSAA